MSTEDPIRATLQQEARARGAVVRQAVVWTPLFLATVGGFVFFFIDEARGGDRGSWFLVGLLGLFALLSGYMSIQALRDLSSGTVEREGLVTRRWARTDSFVFRSHYVRIEPGIILRIDPRSHDIMEGDYVSVRFYRGTGVAVSFERREPPEGMRSKSGRNR